MTIKCECKRHPDSAITVIRLKDGHIKCPRCGKIIIYKYKNEGISNDSKPA